LILQRSIDLTVTHIQHKASDHLGIDSLAKLHIVMFAKTPGDLLEFGAHRGVKWYSRCYRCLSYTLVYIICQVKFLGDLGQKGFAVFFCKNIEDSHRQRIDFPFEYLLENIPLLVVPDNRVPEHERKGPVLFTYLGEIDH